MEIFSGASNCWFGDPGVWGLCCQDADDDMPIVELKQEKAEEPSRSIADVTDRNKVTPVLLFVDILIPL